MSYIKKNDKWAWAQYEIDYLVEFYNKRSNQQLSIQLGREPAAIAMKLKRLKLVRDNRDNHGQFKQGNKLHPEAITGSTSTMYLGGKKVLMLKIEDGTWKNAAIRNYELANGTIPKGYCLKHIDGNYTNVNLSNLQLVPKRRKNQKNEKV